MAKLAMEGYLHNTPGVYCREQELQIMFSVQNIDAAQGYTIYVLIQNSLFSDKAQHN
jgi:hypothetical protein